MTPRTIYLTFDPPVEDEQGNAEAPPDADKDELLYWRLQKRIDHRETFKVLVIIQ